MVTVAEVAVWPALLTVMKYVPGCPVVKSPLWNLVMARMGPLCPCDKDEAKNNIAITEAIVRHQGHAEKEEIQPDTLD